MNTKCYTLLLAAVLIAAPAAMTQGIDRGNDADFVFVNDNGASIPDNSCPNMATSTITVGEAFDWERLEVGVQIEHTWRGDVWLQLESPAGTLVNLLARPGTGSFGTSADNLDALFTDDGPSGVFGGSTPHSVGTPPFQVEGRTEAGGPAVVDADPISDFDDENPAGTWTLNFCDGAAQDTGSLVQWGLFFYAPATSTEEPGTLAQGFALDAAFPNPFTASTTLNLTVAQSQEIRAEVYDALGRRVNTLLSGMVAADSPLAMNLEAGDLPNGVYIVRVIGETFTASQRVMLSR